MDTYRGFRPDSEIPYSGRYAARLATFAPPLACPRSDFVKSLTQELWMNVPNRRGIVSLHDDVERLVAESGVRDGFVLVNTKQI
jgi:hypothetical protein